MSTVEPTDTLIRLQQELEETDSLLKSPRVTAMTRYVLERLKEDLENQIVKLQAERSTGSPQRHAADDRNDAPA